jgi:hypothetical protein
MATVTVYWPTSARVYIRGGEAASGDDRTVHSYEHSQTRCISPSPSHLLRAQRVGEQASEIAVRGETLARVCGRSGFWGAYSRLLASSARPTLIKLLIAGAV